MSDEKPTTAESVLVGLRSGEPEKVAAALAFALEGRPFIVLDCRPDRHLLATSKDFRQAPDLFVLLLALAQQVGANLGLLLQWVQTQRPKGILLPRGQQTPFQ